MDETLRLFGALSLSDSYSPLETPYICVPVRLVEYLVITRLFSSKIYFVIISSEFPYTSSFPLVLSSVYPVLYVIPIV